jgi:hypothetical protein
MLGIFFGILAQTQPDDFLYDESPWIWLGNGIFLLFIFTPAILLIAGTIFTACRWRGAWRYISMLPLFLSSSPFIYCLKVGFGNLWPLGVFIYGVLGVMALIVLAMIYYLQLFINRMK